MDDVKDTLSLVGRIELLETQVKVLNAVMQLLNEQNQRLAQGGMTLTEMTRELGRQMSELRQGQQPRRSWLDQKTEGLMP